MNQKNTECTISPAMVGFWKRAKEDWEVYAQSYKARKDWDNYDFYTVLAEKAEAQILYVEEQLQISSESNIKCGTHGSMMNLNSRQLRTANGGRVQVP